MAMDPGKVHTRPAKQEHERYRPSDFDHCGKWRGKHPLAMLKDQAHLGHDDPQTEPRAGPELAGRRGHPLRQLPALYQMPRRTTLSELDAGTHSTVLRKNELSIITDKITTINITIQNREADRNIFQSYASQFAGVNCAAKRRARPDTMRMPSQIPAALHTSTSRITWSHQHSAKFFSQCAKLSS
ncbi:hypothetical protein, variant 3 [Aphanomyces astaci]|uniref:Uncharacterized protein n=1 Tax=Aphanomyces astaci TaxID=112090 RepID=W4G5K6_APHAT|nr:hypothetical protein, variant 2 [Aphanomyces astaci]XP_009835469.1 hypothetical protein, variant 3 [Aphanomyces astaci]ETV74964.1 hypothetical protein, variant 2 [Aphanomyces astaci]ETV74965.1 hypothetical protein, variant 3 [Aphanomyces astaci]|eukprot:XP_009835468.1 hypothetical protein, variant 2 [Aphanomyces astaci]